MKHKRGFREISKLNLKALMEGEGDKAEGKRREKERGVENLVGKNASITPPCPHRRGPF
jgi:hypothetical protein